MTTKPIKLPNGGRIQYGQLHTRPGNNGLTGIARYGTMKRLADPKAITPGMKRQSVGNLHAYAHGQKVDDEPLQKNWEGKQVPVHPGMVSKTPTHRGVDGDGFAHLQQATDTRNLDKVGNVSPGNLPTKNVGR